MFPKGPVKKVLSPNFIEARIHTDLPASHPHAKFNARIAELRTKFLGEGNIGLPQYIVVDPNDPYKKVLHLPGSSNQETFVRFFKVALEKTDAQ